MQCKVEKENGFMMRSVIICPRSNEYVALAVSNTACNPNLDPMKFSDHDEKRELLDVDLA